MRLWRTFLVCIRLLEPGLPAQQKGEANWCSVAFALAAALAQVLAPNDAQIVNLLGFHVMAKLFVHYPAYLSNIALPRTLAHVSATSALINVCWRLAAGA